MKKIVLLISLLSIIGCDLTGSNDSTSGGTATTSVDGITVNSFVNNGTPLDYEEDDLQYQMDNFSFLTSARQHIYYSDLLENLNVDTGPGCMDKVKAATQVTYAANGVNTITVTNAELKDCIGTDGDNNADVSVAYSALIELRMEKDDGSTIDFTSVDSLYTQNFEAIASVSFKRKAQLAGHINLTYDGTYFSREVNVSSMTGEGSDLQNACITNEQAGTVEACTYYLVGSTKTSYNSMSGTTRFYFKADYNNLTTAPDSYNETRPDFETGSIDFVYNNWQGSVEYFNGTPGVTITNGSEEHSFPMW